MLRLLVDGASQRLKRGGQLWIVTQTYVPVGPLLVASPRLTGARVVSDDGRFTVWLAFKSAKHSGMDALVGATNGITSSAIGPTPARDTCQLPSHEAQTSVSGPKDTLAQPTHATAAKGFEQVAPSKGHTSGQKRQQPFPPTSVTCDRSMTKAQRKRARRKEAAQQALS